MKILIIEDEHKIARLIKEGLEEQTFAIDICHDGDEGLGAARHGDYDLIILDRMLPGGLDGTDICKTLRSEGNSTPILMLTAKDQIQDRIAGLNSGADDYLVKPFSFEELLARIRAVLRRPHQAMDDVLSAEDLTMNVTLKEVRRDGKPIQLSPKEFAILEYLLRNKGKVLSKSVIMNHVWDFDADILPSTVEVFMVYLRAKIEKPFAGPKIIKTIHGYGYKIDS